MKTKLLFLLLVILPGFALYGELRTFDSFYPDCDIAAKERIFLPGGIIETYKQSVSLTLYPPLLRDISFIDPLLARNPAFLVESLMVIPSGASQADLTVIYNSLQRVRNLKGRLYESFTRGKEVPLFEDAVQLANERRLDIIPDPPSVSVAPLSSTLYMRLKDVNFGNTYYRAHIQLDSNSLTYSLTNFRNITYMLIPVIRENRFYAQLYFEPIQEGILIYCIAGADVSNFIASQIDMPSAIRKRLEVIISWVVDGIQNG